MKSKTFNYKEYIGSIDFDIENSILFGKLLFINDVITYEASDLTQLEIEFKAAVEDYLETCELLSRDPQKIYKGSFNVRIGADLHREAAKAAYKTDDNLNEFCRKAIEQRIQEQKAGEKKEPATFRVVYAEPAKEQAPKSLDIFSSTIQYSATNNDEESQQNLH